MQVARCNSQWTEMFQCRFAALSRSGLIELGAIKIPAVLDGI
jgi:hypothetical protein